MGDSQQDPGYQLSLERLKERLRQERETFDQHKAHENKWFTLRLVIAGLAVPALLAIAYFSARIILDHTAYTAAIVTAASSAFFVDTLGLVVSVVKIVFNPDFMTKLAPVTALEEAEREALDRSRKSPTVAGDELVILSARYGADSSWMDVAPLLRTRIQDGRVSVQVENEDLGGDPIHNVLKTLEVAYSYRGSTYSKSVPEHGELAIPG